MQYGSTEEIRNLTIYELGRLAQAKQEVQGLINMRDSYFQSLYDDIQIPHVTINPEDRGSICTGTDRQALQIIDMKTAYDGRILKAKERYGQWLQYLTAFPAEDADLLRRYFEDGDKIPMPTIHRIIRSFIQLHEKTICDRERQTELVVSQMSFQIINKNQERQRKKKGSLFLQNGRLRDS